MAWLTCLIPPAVFIILGSNILIPVTDSMTGSGLLVMSPLFLGLGFAVTAAHFGLCRWGVKKFGGSKVAFVSISLVTIAFVNLAWEDWRILFALEIASLPAALLLAPRVTRDAPIEVDVQQAD